MKFFRTDKFFGIRIFTLLGILAVVAYCSFFFRTFIIDGTSMVPSYENNDIILINKSTYKYSAPEKSDVIIFYDASDKEFLIKRIIGVPHDTIEIKEGYIYVNGKKFQDRFSHARISIMLIDIHDKPLRYWNGPNVGEIVYEHVSQDPITLESNQYWVIGDNRKVSWYGLISVDEIIGETLLSLKILRYLNTK